ncbi:MAG: hypothetical protein KGR26_16760, partial [Cyanobacteria bacterium REEB65]|nr:hypothetical protein [Cyanobacteria bacterium REEB65]
MAQQDQAGWQKAAPQAASTWNDITTDPRWQGVQQNPALMAKATRLFARMVVAPEVGGGKSPAIRDFIQQNIAPASQVPGFNPIGDIGAALQHTAIGQIARGVARGAGAQVPEAEGVTGPG